MNGMDFRLRADKVSRKMVKAADALRASPLCDTPKGKSLLCEGRDLLGLVISEWKRVGFSKHPGRFIGYSFKYGNGGRMSGQAVYVKEGDLYPLLELGRAWSVKVHTLAQASLREANKTKTGRAPYAIRAERREEVQ